MAELTKSPVAETIEQRHMTTAVVCGKLHGAVAVEPCSGEAHRRTDWRPPAESAQ